MFRKLISLFDCRRDPEPDALTLARRTMASANAAYMDACCRGDTRDQHRAHNARVRAKALILAAEVEARR